MSKYFIKHSSDMYVQLIVSDVEFKEEDEGIDYLTYTFALTPDQNDATKFDISSQAVNKLYLGIFNEDFDVFEEEVV